MRTRTSFIVAATMIAVAPTTVATASPPTGMATITDHVRAVTTEGAELQTPVGSNVTFGLYTLAPGAESGWETRQGRSLFAVQKGTLSLAGAEGCTNHEYPAGRVGMVPGGEYRIRNAGSEPLEFVGVFLDLAGTDHKPFTKTTGGAAPTTCPGLGDTGTAGVSMTQHIPGVFVPHYGHSDHAPMSTGIKVEPATDVLLTTYTAEPGFSSGWLHHKPAISIVTRGTLTYYEGHDGQCVESGRYTAGQAYIHSSPHTHMGTNEGTERMDVTILYFNLPHRDPVPVVGNQTDAVDFTPLPPADCPRLR